MSVLSSAAAALLRERAGEAELRGALHPDVLALIYREQWFRCMVPERFGGLGFPLPAVVRLEEAIAQADGSAGWTVTLCSGAGWFAGFFPDSALNHIFSHPRMCIAGSGSVSGKAERLADGGYRVSGQWEYASGARHATAFTANCVVWTDGSPVMEGGQQLVRPFLFLREEVQVLETWKPVGLVATGSHSFVVTDREIPAERCFVIDADHAIDSASLYRYPFIALAEATLAVNSSGMTLHFFECFEQHFSARVARGHLPAAAADKVRTIFEQGQRDFGQTRKAFYTALDRSWAAPAPDAITAVRQTSHELAAAAREWVDRIYPLAGLGAARADTGINRVWRDIHTASQHPLLALPL